jgi:hypothetical protein
MLLKAVYCPCPVMFCPAAAALNNGGCTTQRLTGADLLVDEANPKQGIS